MERTVGSTEGEAEAGAASEVDEAVVRLVAVTEAAMVAVTGAAIVAVDSAVTGAVIGALTGVVRGADTEGVVDTGEGGEVALVEAAVQEVAT